LGIEVTGDAVCVCAKVLTDDPLGDLLIELSSTPTSSRWSERRRAGRSATVALRPRAASCSRHFVSDNTATAADVALTAKSLSHTQLYRKPSNASDVSPTDNGSALHVRHRSHQQLLQPVRQLMTNSHLRLNSIQHNGRDCG